MRPAMSSLLSAIVGAASLAASGSGSAAAEAAPSQAGVAAHLAEATRLAGDDLKALLPLCQPQPAVRASGPALDHFLDRAIAAPSPPPGQAFDNLTTSPRRGSRRGRSRPPTASSSSMP